MGVINQSVSSPRNDGPKEKDNWTNFKSDDRTPESYSKIRKSEKGVNARSLNGQPKSPKTGRKALDRDIEIQREEVTEFGRHEHDKGEVRHGQRMPTGSDYGVPSL